QPARRNSSRFGRGPRLFPGGAVCYSGGVWCEEAEGCVMPSPFPGMDPYIEECGLWEDFHGALIHEIKYRLAQSVPERYVVRTAERPYLVLVESEGKVTHTIVPDVTVTTKPSRKKGGQKGSAAVAEPAGELEPVTLRPFIEEEHREAFV